MALTFVYGNSGNGTSEYMYRKIADMAAASPYQRYFVVVPEQFTMSAQRSLVAHSPSGVILNIDVVSFERLALRVFDETGVRRTVMEETGKSLVLRRIVGENGQRLTLLKRNLSKMGYIGELKSVISELMQYGISPDDLEDFIGELPEETSLSRKLRDILCIYRPFDEYLTEGYVTAERVLEVLTDVADQSRLLRGAVLFFDGYTGFTPVQMNLVRRLMHFVSDIYVTVTTDVREPFGKPAKIEDLFYMSRKMVNTLTRAAAEASFEIADPIRIDADETGRFSQNPVLSHLERNLFRVPSHVYQDPCGDRLQLYSLINPREELRFAAAEIRRLVREKGFRYRDCAIVCSDVELYGRYADAVFSLYDIPGFVDTKQDILYHPLTELIRALFELAETDYSAESVFRLLRTGLAGFSPEETDLLENYCIEKGIRGARKWQEPFTRPFDKHGRLTDDPEREEEELARVNALRERFVSLTGETCVSLSKPDAAAGSLTETLYRFLVDLSVETRLQEQTTRFEEDGDEVMAAVNHQIYRIVIDLLDKMVDLLGEEVLSLSEYAEILEAGFASARVGAIPPGNDCVILGDIERTRLDEIKVLFFLGVNDGQVPKKSSRQSILSQYDREVIASHDIELAPGEREQMFLQRFYLYLALTKPADALYLTFSRMGTDGKAVRPSYLISLLEKMFEDLAVREIDTHEFLPLVTAKSSVESYLTGLIASDREGVTPAFGALHRWYMDHDPWTQRILRLFDAHFYVREPETLDAALAQALYGPVLHNSVTRLESFGRCAFAHFLEYGLKLSERREMTFESPDMGTLFHRTLERYGRNLEASCSWDTVTEEEREELLRRSLEEAAAELPQQLFETAGGTYMLERVYRILRRSIWAVTEQIRRGDFRPSGYEVPFSGKDRTMDDASGASVRLGGTVDRMDLCTDGENVGVRVIDYKSSDTDLDLQKVYYGRQLQLPIYLSSALELLKEEYPDRRIVPAGLFYIHLDDPMIEDEGKDEEERTQELLKKLRPKGVVNDDPDLYLRMDRNLEEGGESVVVPVKITGKGTPDRRGSKILPGEQFEDLAAYARLVTDEASRQMLKGTIDMSPYRQGGKTGCDYCAFRSICGFDPKIPGFRFREQEKMSDAGIWDAIHKKVNDGTE